MRRTKQITVRLTPAEYQRLCDAYANWVERRGPEQTRTMNGFYASRLVPKAKEGRNGMATD